MANVLLANRDNTVPPLTVGECWVNRFINRHDEIQSKFSGKYNYQQALCKNPKIIREWFKLVWNTMEKYRILPQDTYNFDEIGSLMGIIATARVVTGSEKNFCLKLIQPGN
jgi:RecB family endonuclease NucS